MNYIEFQNIMLGMLKGILGAEYDVNIHKVMKNNDVELVSVMIQKESESGAVPTIYLEDYYEMYNVGVKLDDIANSIIALYMRQKGKVNISIDDFKSFDYVKSKVMLKLINYERNRKGLTNIPHKRILDLAVVLYVLWDEEDDLQMTAIVTNSHMQMWGVDFENLYDIAYNNTIIKLSTDIRNLQDVIYDIYKKAKLKMGIDKELEEEIIAELNDRAYPMYVISNRKRILGASVILYDQVLKYFYEKFGGKFYILPSSIHEVIVVPVNDMSIDEMKNMVTEINENEVDYLEVLSDNVYCYDGNELILV